MLYNYRERRGHQYFFSQVFGNKMIGGFFFAQCPKDLACRDATIDINEHVAIINCRIIEAI